MYISNLSFTVFLNTFKYSMRLMILKLSLIQSTETCIKRTVYSKEASNFNISCAITICNFFLRSVSDFCIKIEINFKVGFLWKIFSLRT